MSEFDINLFSISVMDRFQMVMYLKEQSTQKQVFCIPLCRSKLALTFSVELKIDFFKNYLHSSYYVCQALGSRIIQVGHVECKRAAWQF